MRFQNPLEQVSRLISVKKVNRTSNEDRSRVPNKRWGRIIRTIYKHSELFPLCCSVPQLSCEAVMHSGVKNELVPRSRWIRIISSRYRERVGLKRQGRDSREREIDALTSYPAKMIWSVKSDTEKLRRENVDRRIEVFRR